MRAVLTPVLLLFALATIVTGELYRTCDCRTDGRCCAGHARASEGGRAATRNHGTCPSCCHDVPAKDAPHGDDSGCRICCKPRAPFGEATDGPTLEAPQRGVLAVLAALDATTLERDSHLARCPRDATARPPTGDPWQLSPAGLSVFLI